eukprot:TRINITY_DN7078_c0_g1_i2.p1 TRINITY_DN7078_c0_g1~~TRINITY_DN7078_c0_g1_i2.p1  ORF type:complete len:283 (+),score=-29.49 TRINITY_DN7078_c0_g1_i2:62-910(+)
MMHATVQNSHISLNIQSYGSHHLYGSTLIQLNKHPLKLMSTQLNIQIQQVTIYKSTIQTNTNKSTLNIYTYTYISDITVRSKDISFCQIHIIYVQYLTVLQPQRYNLHTKYQEIQIMHNPLQICIVTKGIFTVVQSDRDMKNYNQKNLTYKHIWQSTQTIKKTQSHTSMKRKHNYIFLKHKYFFIPNKQQQKKIVYNCVIFSSCKRQAAVTEKQTFFKCRKDTVNVALTTPKKITQFSEYQVKQITIQIFCRKISTHIKSHTHYTTQTQLIIKNKYEQQIMN